MSGSSTAKRLRVLSVCIGIRKIFHNHIRENLSKILCGFKISSSAIESRYLADNKNYYIHENIYAHRVRKYIAINCIEL